MPIPSESEKPIAKQYKLTEDRIQRMIPDYGVAFATDRITVDGEQVAYMVRHKPDCEEDSGWVLHSKGESPEYIDDPENTSVFDLNTLCNYDPEIIRYLTYPPGTEVERNDEGKLRVTTESVDEPSMVFMYPVDVGRVSVTDEWSFMVNSRMLRRFEDSELVIWKPGFTIWLSVSLSGLSVADKIQKVLEDESAKGAEAEQETVGNLTKLRYFLEEEIDGNKQKSANIVGFAEGHEIYMSIYYDIDEVLPEIDLIWQTLAY